MDADRVVIAACFIRDGLVVEWRTDGTTSPPGGMTPAVEVEIKLDEALPANVIIAE